MKTYLMIVLTLCVLLVGSNSLQAGIVITVDGQVSGASLSQSDTLNWIITGLSSGATVTNQLWIDLDSNGIVDPASDVFFVSFSQTDGVSGGDGAPSDIDGIANGTITTILPGLSFPVGHYILKSTTGTDSASATFIITAMISPTYSISGSVSEPTGPVQNIVVRAQTFSENKSEYYGLTDATGIYTIATNLAFGTVVKVAVPTGDFNSSINGYVATPSEDTLTLTTNFTGIDFVLTAGKIITGYVNDTTGNPLVNINVSIYPPNGGTNYNGTTDAAGKYIVAVPTGLYIVQFGNQDQTNGYVLTFYNQRYVQWLCDTIHIISSTDTLKDINAVLRKGGVITGTVTNAGSNGWNISVFQYGVSGNPSFAKWFEDSGIYYFTVLPGTYSIQFNKNGSSDQFYYNQIGVFPGTAVTVNAIGDTVKNIDADFNAAITEVVQSKSTTPKEFALNQNYPNPFNPSTTITFTLAEDSYVSLKIFDMLGREVATLVDQNLKAGEPHSAVFNASKLSSGLYFYRLESGKQTQVKKLMFLK